LYLQLDDKHLLIFGGLNKRQRYNDVWVLNWESKEWSKVTPAGAAPEERAHFTATRFGNRIFIFGGYGGSGQVFNDMWLLHFDMAEGSFAWENISDSIGGVGPSPRFDHCAFIYPITPNSSSYDKLLIMGGRDLSTMFADSHMLDLNSMHWEETQPPTLPYEVCREQWSEAQELCTTWVLSQNLGSQPHTGWREQQAASRDSYTMFPSGISYRFPAQQGVLTAFMRQPCGLSQHSSGRQSHVHAGDNKHTCLVEGPYKPAWHG
jgi:hypothetical protein